MSRQHSQVEARMKREHEEKYAKLARTLGEDSLGGLVRDLLPRVREALAAGDEHLNSIPLATWDARAGMQRRDGLARCCAKVCTTKFCPHCGKQLRRTSTDGQLWPYSELSETARDPSLPWRKAPGLSLAERVCVLKFTAAKLAAEVQS